VNAVTPEFLSERLELADQLLAGRKAMLNPQDLPGRYGRVVKAIDHVLQATGLPAGLAGGWAVWRHGFVGRVTQDVDVVLPAAGVDEFLRVALLAGFDALPQVPGRWPKLMHRETNVEVDILPEGQRPGTPSRPAPTTIRHPSAMGAVGHTLRYLALPCLIELKLAAGRPRDEADVAELVRVNLDQVVTIHQHLATIHADYLVAFDRLVERAREQEDR
jgi:hypothetical protein